MDKFVPKEPRVSSNNQSWDQGLTVDNNVDPDVDNDHRDEQAEKEDNDDTTKKYTSVMIHVCHSGSLLLSCIYIHDKFMTESR